MGFNFDATGETLGECLRLSEERGYAIMMEIDNCMNHTLSIVETMNKIISSYQGNELFFAIAYFGAVIERLMGEKKKTNSNLLK